MTQDDSRPSRKKAYEAPTVVEVQVDPQRELLMATACVQFFNPSDPPTTPCNQNPC